MVCTHLEGILLSLDNLLGCLLPASKRVTRQRWDLTIQQSTAADCGLCSLAACQQWLCFMQLVFVTIQHARLDQVTAAPLCVLDRHKHEMRLN